MSGIIVIHNNKYCQWYFDPLKTEDLPVKVVKRIWPCPNVNCSGQMVYNGTQWPMNEAGYHHTCTECGDILAVKEKFPRIEYLNEQRDA